jgi:mannose-6-phosphate isomerase
MCAESWEVSDRPGGASVIANGPLRGRPLPEAISAWGAELAGRGAPPGRFPLLVKLIDAHERLSLQVHPDEESAARLGGEAKTEAWHVLEAAGEACVYAGLNPGVTPAQFREALRGPAVADLLRRVPVAAGDTLFVPGGRPHAIGEGCLLLEVQQNADTTFRLYDWGRVGTDGRARPLHVAKALAAIRWDDAAPVTLLPRPTAAGNGWRIALLAECRHFRLERLELAGPLEQENDGGSFRALFAAEGEFTIEGSWPAERVAFGRTGLVPAALARYTLVPAGGPVRVLCARMPQPGDGHGEGAQVADSRTE